MPACSRAGQPAPSSVAWKSPNDALFDTTASDSAWFCDSWSSRMSLMTSLRPKMPPLLLRYAKYALMPSR